MAQMSPADVRFRSQVARAVLSMEAAPFVPAAGGPAGLAAAVGPLSIPWPGGLGPVPRPPAAPPDADAPLPAADVLVVTWTAAEHQALADVLTRGHPAKTWIPYRHRFGDYRPKIRKGAPAQIAGRVGSWFPVTIGDRRVLCFKSELHLNQDGIPTGDGTATLPVRDMFAQLIEEAQPRLVLTVGTSGGVYADHGLGDVVVTRAAKFRLADEFANEPFNQQLYRSQWDLPTAHVADAEELMAQVRPRLVEPGFGPPTKRYPFQGTLLESPPNLAAIRLDGVDFPEFHPILTTDYFEFGTSDNHLDQEGCAVEMGDAVLGLACEDLADPPRWAVVRNLSDPQINADLPIGGGQLNMQVHWAVWYYAVFGYWTSVAGALATWGLIAGFEAS